MQSIIHKRWCQLEKNAYAYPECIILTMPQPEMVKAYYNTCGETYCCNCHCKDDLELEHVVLMFIDTKMLV